MHVFNQLLSFEIFHIQKSIYISVFDWNIYYNKHYYHYHSIKKSGRKSDIGREREKKKIHWIYSINRKIHRNEYEID